MRIQSTFKDYYDFVSHKFGEDPDIVYRRKNLFSGAGKYFVSQKVDWAGRDYFQDTMARSYPPVGKKARGIDGIGLEYHLEWIVAGPHVTTFLVREVDGVAPTYERIVLKDPRYVYLFVHNFDRWSEKDRREYDKKFVPWPRVPEGEKLNDLIRTVGAPVFRLWRPGRHGKLVVADRVPVLKDFGFPAYIAPEQMWQDIYATITNVLRHNPDKAPPVTVEEKYRIEAAGFDLKTSFRNPINLRKLK